MRLKGRFRIADIRNSEESVSTAVSELRSTSGCSGRHVPEVGSDAPLLVASVAVGRGKPLYAVATRVGGDYAV